MKIIVVLRQTFRFSPLTHNKMSLQLLKKRLKHITPKILIVLKISYMIKIVILLLIILSIIILIEIFIKKEKKIKVL